MDNLKCPKCDGVSFSSQADSRDVFCLSCKSWFVVKDGELAEWTTEQYENLPTMDKGKDA